MLNTPEIKTLMGLNIIIGAFIGVATIYAWVVTFGWPITISCFAGALLVNSAFRYFINQE